MVKRNRKSVNSGKQSKSYEVLDSAAVSLLLGGDVKSFVKEMHPNADEASLEFYADVFSFFQIERRETPTFASKIFWMTIICFQLAMNAWTTSSQLC